MSGIPTYWLWGNAPYILAMSPEERYQLWIYMCARNSSEDHTTLVWSVDHNCHYLSPSSYPKDSKITKEHGHLSFTGALDWRWNSGVWQKEVASQSSTTPAFHYEILRPYLHVTNRCLKVMLGQWWMSAEKKELVKVF